MKILSVKFTNMLGVETIITKKEMKFTYKDMLDYVNMVLINFNECEVNLKDGTVKKLNLK